MRYAFVLVYYYYCVLVSQWASSFLFHSNHHRPFRRLPCGSSVTATRSAVLFLAQHLPVDNQFNVSLDYLPNEPLWRELLTRFQGDFDNYEQVQQDRNQGLLPRELGGHEHIHCTLMPLTDNTRLAAFYFDGQPQLIFRFRFYQLLPTYEHTERTTNVGGEQQQQQFAVDTILYTLDPKLEGLLRANSTEPLQWKSIYDDYCKQNTNNELPIQLLPKCEVRWSYTLDPEQHAYALDVEPKNTGIHAVMVYGQALVQSQMKSNMTILIIDQLSLWDNALWIHDRGFDPETNAYIYGNQRNVPYQLQRVADATRTVTYKQLQWTLGPAFRTHELYQAKMNAIGGPSIPKR
jgi:hypothetical protein